MRNGAEATGPQALIVAHGWPGYPAVAEAELAWLAARVATLVPEGRIASATLAAPGALEQAVARSDPGRELVIYPFFMSDGWFVTEYLRGRVGRCAPRSVRWRDPLGLSPRLPALCAQVVRQGLGRLDPGRASFILAAHGSPDNPRPAEIARALSETLAARLGFAAHRTGFVDEDPRLETVLRPEGPAICLPLFALLSGHMRRDLPEAVAASGYKGILLPAIGTTPGVPGIVAEAIKGT